MSPNDVLIAMDNHTAALIKCTAGMDELEDLKQFAAALQETVQEETGLPLTVGSAISPRTRANCTKAIARRAAPSRSPHLPRG